jgi:hypothetical protein
VDVLADDSRSAELKEASKTRVAAVLDAYERSPRATAMAQRPPAVQTNWSEKVGVASWVNQWRVLAGRGLRNAYRNRWNYGIK